MVRNRQISYPEEQDFNNQKLTNINSIKLNSTTGSVAPGELKRLSDNTVVIGHPIAGTVVLVDANGNVGSVLNSDKFMQIVVHSFTSTTITHSFGRPAQVRVFEGNSESECAISYPFGEENSKVTIESNVPITATIFLN
jgi:hypothetical protein